MNRHDEIIRQLSEAEILDEITKGPPEPRTRCSCGWDGLSSECGEAGECPACDNSDETGCGPHSCKR